MIHTALPKEIEGNRIVNLEDIQTGRMTRSGCMESLRIGGEFDAKVRKNGVYVDKLLFVRDKRFVLYCPPAGTEPVYGGSCCRTDCVWWMLWVNPYRVAEVCQRGAACGILFLICFSAVRSMVCSAEALVSA